MGNALPLIVILLLLGPAIFVGHTVDIELKSKAPEKASTTIAYPYKGSVEILNGCGISGVATKISNILRKNHFDVKSIGNVVVNNRTIYNYTKTIVISRNKDMKVAKEVAKLLHCKPPIYIRTDYNESDVTVIIGHDFGDLINYDK